MLSNFKHFNPDMAIEFLRVTEKKPKGFTEFIKQVRIDDLNDKQLKVLIAAISKHNEHQAIRHLQQLYDRTFDLVKTASFSELATFIDLYHNYNLSKKEKEANIVHLALQRVRLECLSLTAREASHILQALHKNSVQIEEDIQEILDKVIGTQLHSLDVSEIIPTLRCLEALSSQKIFYKFMEKIKLDLNLLTSKQLSQIGLIYYEQGKLTPTLMDYIFERSLKVINH